MAPELEEKLPVDSVIIAALLHDACKANIYKETLLNRKNDQGYWEKVPGYEVDYSNLPLGHGEKSVIMPLADIKVSISPKICKKTPLLNFGKRLEMKIFQ